MAGNIVINGVDIEVHDLNGNKHLNFSEIKSVFLGNFSNEQMEKEADRSDFVQKLGLPKGFIIDKSKAEEINKAIIKSYITSMLTQPDSLSSTLLVSLSALTNDSEYTLLDEELKNALALEFHETIDDVRLKETLTRMSDALVDFKFSSDMINGFKSALLKKEADLLSKPSDNSEEHNKAKNHFEKTSFDDVTVPDEPVADHKTHFDYRKDLVEYIANSAAVQADLDKLIQARTKHYQIYVSKDPGSLDENSVLGRFNKETQSLIEK